MSPPPIGEPHMLTILKRSAESKAINYIIINIELCTNPTLIHQIAEPVHYHVSTSIGRPLIKGCGQQLGGVVAKLSTVWYTLQL